MAKEKSKEVVQKEEDRDKVFYELLWKKYNALDLNKIYFTKQLPDGTYTVSMGGKKIPGNQLGNMQNEAQMMKRSLLWSVMQETLKNTAQQYMFVQMKTIEDAQYGKAMLYALSIIDTILTSLTNTHEEKTPQPASAQVRYPQGYTGQ